MKFFKGISSLILSILILGSTMSFTVHKHFCLSSLQDVSIIIPSQGCGMENMMSASSKSDCEVVMTSCCNDVKELIEGQDVQKLSTDFNLNFHWSLDMTYESFQAQTLVLKKIRLPRKILDDPPSQLHQPYFILFQHFVV